MNSHQLLPSQRLYGFSLNQGEFGQWSVQLLNLLEIIRSNGINLVEKNLTLKIDEESGDYFFGVSVTEVITPIPPFEFCDLENEIYISFKESLEKAEIDLENLRDLLESSRNSLDSMEEALESGALVKWNFVDWDGELNILLKVKRVN